ncbi:MAG: right-handed parallel beta-helix repeat-containing protein [Phycisphaerales bacterium]|nr:right-handed parallel beta-helix repeat-containing protein [Phycisphaerales bacterium]
MSRLPTLALVIATMLLAPNVRATTMIYVDGSAVGPTHDGLTWCTAYRNPQPALIVAVAGQTIRVAEGTYTPDPTGLSDPRDAMFSLKTGIILEGGYAGCGAADPDARDGTVYQTILSGDLNGNDAPNFIGREDNTYHVVICDGVDSTGVIDGFTITGGNANAIDPGRDVGGGMYIVNGACTVNRCTFHDNLGGHAEPSTDCCCEHPTPGCGPADCEAVVCAIDPTCCTDRWDASCVQIARSDCFDCFMPVSCNPTLTGGGGGLYHENSSSRIADCTFAENRSPSFGGGILNKNGHPILTNCRFVSNSAESNGDSSGGAIYSRDGGDLTLTDSTLLGNSASIEGGGLFLGPSIGTTITNCSFEQNNALFGGGADFVGDPESPSSPVVTNCRFLGNSYGGVHVSNGNPTFVNCMFSGNSGFAGGGLYVQTMSIFFSTAPRVTNCTFSHNRVFFLGGGVYSGGADSVLENCILWDNADRDGAGEAAQFHAAGEGSPLVSFSAIQGLTGTSSWNGTGNIGSDPQFVDVDGYDGVFGTPDDDLRLKRGSPCIDTANNSALSPTITTDLEGNPRIVDGNLDMMAVVDMGALEFQPSDDPIPAVSQWGGLILAMLVLSAGTIVLKGRSPRAFSPP